jgi:DNA polymerase V
VERIFGLIDGNSFYCSCERAFQPRLRRLPVVVLSNNDGCAIARTAEAKALGVKMGDPWHLVRGKRELAGVEWLSSNYALYGDMSRRMFQVLAERVPRVEPYSIDEMFLDLAGLPGDLTDRCRSLRDDVRRLAKIPTCIGWGPSKTIAKLANMIAKNNPSMDGVCDLTLTRTRAVHYAELPASEVWGIGAKTAEKLGRAGIQTIAEFVAMDTQATRELLTVVGARIQQELRGVSCLPLNEWAATRKGVASTRSFGRPITQWPEMREAVAAYASRAAEKLRAEGLQACHMAVFLQTNPHAPDEPWHSGQRAARIEPTNDSRDLIREAVRMLQPLWRDGYRYAKAGVMLDDLVPQARQPAMMFPTRDPVRSKKVMAAMDAVNARYGRGTLRPLATGIARSWGTRSSRLSPRYTTHAGEMLEATAW